MARRLSAAHKKAISMALRRVKGATTGLDEYKPKPKKPAAPKKPTRASAGSGKKTAVKKTAGKKPAPAKAPAKKTAAKKAPAKKAPARKNVLPAPDNSPMPKKKTAATNRPTPKAETPAQARKADAEFKANREARRDSTPFGSIRNSMAEAQLINGRNSDRDRDEDLAEAIQRDSKLTYAEQEAKRNAGTVAQLNAAKRRKAELREKELAAKGKSAAEVQAEIEKNALPLQPPSQEAMREGIKRRRGEMSERARQAVGDSGRGAVRPTTRAEQAEISRKYGSAETQQFSGTPGTWVGRDEAPNMARAGDIVHGTGKSEFFKGEMKIVGDPYVEDDGHAYVEVSKRNGTIELARADMEGNVLDDEGNVVAVRVTEGGTKIKRAASRGRGKSAKRSDAPDPRVSGFNTDGLW